MYGGVAVQVHLFLTSPEHGSKWPASLPDLIISGQKSDILWLEGCLGLKAGIGALYM